MSLGASGSSGGAEPVGALERRLCQVGGLNQNYVSGAGTPYHIQIEDRGPVYDAVAEREVRRVNVIVYANYGEPNARIIHGQDHDFPDLRSQEHNRFVVERIQQLANEARGIIEEKERRRIGRIKELLRLYYETKDETAKKAFAEANALYPFVFSRAWSELRQDRSRATRASAQPQEPSGEPEALPEEIVYPLDADLRERVIEIERIIVGLGRDLHRLRTQGSVDDILLQTCRKLVARAKESISGRDGSDFSERRLDMMRNSLRTTWRQVRSRLKT